MTAWKQTYTGGIFLLDASGPRGYTQFHGRRRSDGYGIGGD